MNVQKTLAIALALVVIIVVAVRLTKSSSPLLGGRPDTASSGAAVPRNLPADAVLAIAPGSGAPAAHRPVSVLSPVLKEYAHAQSYKALYDRLRPASSRTPEETWILAKILQACGALPNRRPDSNAAIAEDEAVARFASALPARDPSREKRIAAYRQEFTGHCRELKDIPTSQEAIRDLLAQAAAGGDPKAAASLVYHDLWTPLQASMGNKFSMATAPWPAISTAQVQDLEHAAESGDPFALAIAGHTLAGPFTNLSLQNAQDGRPIEIGSFSVAAQLLACDAGYPCGPDAPQIQSGCAYSGNCDAQTLREYEFFYALSPESSQRVSQYQAMLTRAVRDHDWSSFTFHPAPSPFLAPYVKP
jgi:hypothetical protein